MVRVKRGVGSKRKKRRMMTRAKGFRGGLRTQHTRRKLALIKAGVHATRHRKQKKSEMRALWIARINAAVRQAGLTYSRFIAAIKKHKVLLDRRSLADLAVNHADDFKKLVELAKA